MGWSCFLFFFLKLEIDLKLKFLCSQLEERGFLSVDRIIGPSEAVIKISMPAFNRRGWLRLDVPNNMLSTLFLQHFIQKRKDQSGDCALGRNTPVFRRLDDAEGQVIGADFQSVEAPLLTFATLKLHKEDSQDWFLESLTSFFCFILSLLHFVSWCAWSHCQELRDHWCIHASSHCQESQAAGTLIQPKHKVQSLTVA